MKPGLTDQARRSVVEEAIRLLKLPKSFVQGSWKCKLYEKKGKDSPEIINWETAADPSPTLKPLLDSQGRQQFSYCVEGAVNQAAINVLPLDIAIRLGATDGSKKWGEVEPRHDSRFIDYLSVNDVARLTFAELLDDIGQSHSSAPARAINDWGMNEEEYEGKTVAELVRLQVEAKEAAHDRVLTMLRTRLSQLRS